MIKAILGIGFVLFFLSSTAYAQEKEDVQRVILEDASITQLPPHRYDISLRYGNSSQVSAVFSYCFSFKDPPSLVKYSIEGMVHSPNPSSGFGVEPLNLNDHGFALWGWLIAPDDSTVNLAPRLGYRWLDGSTATASDSLKLFFYGVQLQLILYPGASTLFVSYDQANADPSFTLSRYQMKMDYQISYSFSLEAGYASSRYPVNFGVSHPPSPVLISSDNYFVGLNYGF